MTVTELNPRRQRRALIWQQAKARMSLNDQLGIALRHARRSAGMSQRAYARDHGRSPSRQARLETRASDIATEVVVEALEPTWTALGVRSLTDSGGEPRIILGRAEIRSVLADAISAAKAASGRTYRALADRTGVPVATLHRAATAPDQMSIATVRRVLQALGLDLVALSRDARAPLLMLTPDVYPEASVAPRVRGGRRRLAAHRWIRPCPGGPRWWWLELYRPRRYKGDPPDWTAEYPHERLAPSALLAG